MLKAVYRFMLFHGVKKFILPFFISAQRAKDSFEDWERLIAIRPRPIEDSSHDCTDKKRSRIWCHAASVGELEALWPIICKISERGHELIVTIFSESAKKSLFQLKDQLLKTNVQLIFSGYAPWEGQWSEAFQRLRPSLFLTTKYEAWPDLWFSLIENDIPLAMISAKNRKSLRIVNTLCRRVTGKTPNLLLFVDRERRFK